MKRVVFASILMLTVIFFNSFCLYTVEKTNDEVYKKIETITFLFEGGDIKETALECEKFADYWHKKSRILCLIVRHEPLDRMSSSVACLCSYARYSDYSELSAELGRCRSVMDEITDAERPLLRNIF